MAIRLKVPDKSPIKLGKSSEDWLLFPDDASSLFKIHVLEDSLAGHCTVVQYQNNFLQIDCGTTPAFYKEAFPKRSKPIGVLISHGHAAHFSPELFEPFKKSGWPEPTFYYGKARSYADRKKLIKPFFIRQTRVSHDYPYTCGFVIQAGAFKYGHFTDLGKVTKNVLRACQGLTHLQIEAHHDDITSVETGAETHINEKDLKRFLSDRGHLSLSQTLDALKRIIRQCPNLNHVIIGHLHPDLLRPSYAISKIRKSLESQWIRVPQLYFKEAGKVLSV